ncbi:MAG: hypothetical protein AAF236_09095 [Verrucomicrobiota bacterium]
MQDPFYSRLIFAIEGQVHDYDLKTHDAEGVTLKDSDVKSALRKAISLIKGSGNSKPPKGQSDRLKFALAREIVEICENEREVEGVSAVEFTRAILAVEDTLKLRREMAGHSRGYLEFLREFIPGARGD